MFDLRTNIQCKHSKGGVDPRGGGGCSDVFTHT